MNDNKNVKQCLENFIKDEYGTVLRDFGIKLIDNNGLDYKVLYQGRKLPRITYSKSNDNFVIYYQAPDDLGQQQFVFDYNDFVYCFNQNKRFYLLDNNPNTYVVFILNFFFVNPSFLRRLRGLKKWGRQLVRLDKFNLNAFEKYV